MDDEKPRRRGGITCRGLSKNLIGVIVAVNSLGGVVDGILDNSSTKAIANVLNKRLSPTAKLCIDGGSALWGFVSQKILSFAMKPSGKYVSEYDPIFHIQTVNTYHSRLKNWIRRFRGVATKYFNSYFELFRKFKRSTYCLSNVE